MNRKTIQILSSSLYFVALVFLFSNKVSAARYTIANSAASYNKTQYINLRDYPQTQSNWPKRAECGLSDFTYKTMPWLADTRNLRIKTASTSDPFTPDPYVIWGNYVDEAGDCASNWSDGGTNTSDNLCTGGGFRGPWLCKSAFGGWTGAGAVSWPNACNAVGTPTDSGKMGGATPRIWANSCTKDYTDSAPTLFQRNNPSYTETTNNGRPVGIYSNGTALFRNEFVISNTQMNDLTLSRLDPYLDIIADDFYAVYINGTPVTYEPTTARRSALLIPYNLFKVGTNVIAIQVIDKAYWDYNIDNTGGGVGLWYDLFFWGNNTADPLISALSCSAVRNPVARNSTASFTASGGVGPYYWRADNGTPRNDWGNTFYTSFSSNGTEEVRVEDSRGNTVECDVVVVPPSTVTCDSFTATPSSIKLGQAFTFSWAYSGNPTSAIITPGSYSATTNPGSRAVTPTSTGTFTYTLTLRDGNGIDVTCPTVSVEVKPNTITPKLGPWDSVNNLPPVL